MHKYYPHGQPDAETYLENYFEQILNHWVWHVGNYLLQKKGASIHFVFYERLLHDFAAELQHLPDYLEISLSRASQESIAGEVHFSSLKSDNPRHVQQGKANRWKAQLSEAQKEKARQLAGPLMYLLNYPLEEDEEQMPAFPEQQFVPKVNRILKQISS
jgi:aryl sulfotransferase